MIELAGVTKRYGAATVVDRVSLTIPRGGVTALIGHNGAGKSTLLSIIGRLLAADAGAVRVDGMDVARAPGEALARRLSILRQENQVAVRITVRELVEFGRFPYSKGRLKDADREQARRAIEFMELQELAGRPISRLSGGQRQRAFIAMTLCQDTDYVLLDEPLNNLDLRHAAQTMSLIGRLASELNKTVLIVLHDVNFASYHADRVIAMKDGAVAADGPPGEIVTERNMADIFGLAVPVYDWGGRPVAAYFAMGAAGLAGLEVGGETGGAADDAVDE